MLNRFLILIFCFTAFVIPSFAQEPDKKPPAKANSRPDKPETKPEPYDKSSVQEMTKCVNLETAMGSIELEMFPVTAPITVRNFLNLTAIGAFDNTTFSRVVPGFVIQGGILHTNKNITYELAIRASKPLADEPNLVRHVRGIVSMARGDEPNSAGTSFFILVDEAPTLDNKFASFGRVVKGMDVVDAINKMPVVDEEPKEPVLITKAAVKECDLVVEEAVAVVEPEAVKKVNDLPRFGFRGKVKSVRESISELKGKKEDWRKADQHSIRDSLSEFGEIGDFVRMVITQDGHTVTNTNEYPPAGSTKDFTFKDVLRNAEGEVVSEALFKRTSATTLEFVFFEGMIVKKKGTIVTNIDGRNLKLDSQVIDADGKIKRSLITTMTYDAYGFMTSRIQVDGDGKQVFYDRFEYTDLDDNANWIVQLVFDSEDSEKPVRIVKRVFEYYEDKE